MRTVSFLAALLMTCSGFAQDTGVRIWAVGDGVRLNPVTGKLIESRPDIHKDYPAADPGWKFRVGSCDKNRRAEGGPQ